MIISQLLVNKIESTKAHFVCKLELGLYFSFFLRIKIPLYGVFFDTVCREVKVLAAISRAQVCRGCMVNPKMVNLHYVDIIGGRIV